MNQGDKTTAQYSINGRSTQIADTALQAAQQSIRDRYAPSERGLLKYWKVEPQNQEFEGWEYFSLIYKGELNETMRVMRLG